MIAASGVDAARLSALAGFARVALWTPELNNILLARAGAAFGFRRTIPHCVGVVLGYSAMIFILAYGLGEAFRAERTLQEGVRLAGIAVLLYLAWRIVAAPWRESTAAAARPVRVLERRRRSMGESEGLVRGGVGIRSLCDRCRAPVRIRHLLRHLCRRRLHIFCWLDGVRSSDREGLVQPGPPEGVQCCDGAAPSPLRGAYLCSMTSGRPRSSG